MSRYVHQHLPPGVQIEGIVGWDWEICGYSKTACYKGESVAFYGKRYSRRKDIGTPPMGI